MSILDDAIREHLELKRAHGADDAEVKKLEDEAFGPPQRPDEIDPFAEAPTEFLIAPAETAAEAPEIGDEGERSGRRPDIADLQEPPPAPSARSRRRSRTSSSPAPDAPPPSPTDAADVPLPPPPGEAPTADLAPPTGRTRSAAGPTTPRRRPTSRRAADRRGPPRRPRPRAKRRRSEEHPAGEHEAIADAGPNTEERHAIADQPTQMFDVQAHVDAEAAPTRRHRRAGEPDRRGARRRRPGGAAGRAARAGGARRAAAEIHEQPPLDIRGPDAEVAGHPPAEAEPEEGSGRIRLLQRTAALRRARPGARGAAAADRRAPGDAAVRGRAGAATRAAIFDFESPRRAETYEEDPSEEVLRRADERGSAPRSRRPRSRRRRPPRRRAVERSEPPSEEPPRAAAEPASEEAGADFDPDTGHEDVLEDTPRFLEDAPEDDDLWFEQKPPKDFDLD